MLIISCHADTGFSSHQLRRRRGVVHGHLDNFAGVHAVMQAYFLKLALRGMKFDLFENCPDPIADEDETDVYRERCSKVCFLGIPCTGGDYNDGPVFSRVRSLKCVSEALCRIVERLVVIKSWKQGKII